MTVSPSDPNVVYAGTGESCVRADVVHGDGVYRSRDAGLTWEPTGLRDTHHIGRVVVDPLNPDVVYCAALGHLYGSSSERGVYRSRDGASSWQSVLSSGPDTGAVDISIDPCNRNLLFASLWQVRRSPWSLISGGVGSSLFVTVDGGTTWIDLGSRPGFPPGQKGKIGVAVAPGGKGRVWALVEAAAPGLYRSDDWGETWTLTSSLPDLVQRPFYYMHVVAHPSDPETVYVLNVWAWRSVDGGQTFTKLSLDHEDQHALWIDPSNTDCMILGNDIGAIISRDGGETWSSHTNQPISAFYNAVPDARKPYRLYGSQQDSTTLSIPSRTETGLITNSYSYPVGGGESGGIAVTPDLPGAVYAVGYDARQTRFDCATGRVTDISIWAEDRIGSSASQVRYRFSWSTPIIASKYSPQRVFCAAQFVFRSDDSGASWSQISPDLTRGDPRTLGTSGGPISPENTTAEYYACLVVLVEDPSTEHTLWAGSDDGLIHVTRDGGASWRLVSPDSLRSVTRITSIEIDPNNSEVVYVTGSCAQSDDERPIIVVSLDGGLTWGERTEGLPAAAVCRAIRCDPRRKGVMYLATDDGVMLCPGDGLDWESLQYNLPVCPVYDLAIANDDLVAATHGRSIWILEGLGAMLWRRELEAEPEGGANASIAPLAPVARLNDLWIHVEPLGETDHLQVSVGVVGAKGVRTRGLGVDQDFTLVDAGFRHPNEVAFLYVLPGGVRREGALEVRRNGGGQLVRRLGVSSESMPQSSAAPGICTTVWDLRYAPALVLTPEHSWYAYGNYGWGPIVEPGIYTVELVTGEQVVASTSLAVELSTDDSGRECEIADQVRFLLEIRDRLSAAHAAVVAIREALTFLDRVSGRGTRTAVELRAELESAEAQLVSREVVGEGDYNRYPSGLNGRLMGLAFRVGGSAGGVSPSHRAVLEELRSREDSVLARLRELAGPIDDLRRRLGDDGSSTLSLDFPGVAFDHESLWQIKRGS